MATRRTRGPRSSPHGIIGLVALVFAITASGALAGSSRSAREPEQIFVTAVSGSVSVTMAGSSTPVQLDSNVGLPARIITGDDGMLSLTQAGTNITIAADSDVEIPAEAADGQLIARLVQRRGNVFYDVAHREAGTLHVETPFLVAVIKGTQFNVAVQDGGSTISLFQGRLQILTPDGSDSVFINAGEIAKRSNIDNAISVIGMNDKRVDLPRSGNAVGRDDAANNDAPPAGFAIASLALDSTHGLGADAGAPGHGGRPNGSSTPTVTIDSVAAIIVDTSDNHGLHLGNGNGSGNNPGLHLANGNGLGLGNGLGVGNGNSGAGNNPGLGLGNGNGLGLGNGNGTAGNDPGLGLGNGNANGSTNGNAGNNSGLGVGLGNGNAGGDPGLQVSVGNGNGNAGDNPGLHLGNGGSIGDNPGLHLGNGNGNGNLAPPGKSHGHP